MKPIPIPAILLLAGCQFLLPDIEIIDDDTGADGDSDTDSDTGQGGVGDPCADDGDCQSGNCENQVCCAAGEVCCTGDEHCVLGGQHLACNASAFACFQQCTEGGIDYDDRCAAGYFCQSDVCHEQMVTGACYKPSQCISGECLAGFCCEHAGLCCAADGDCPDLFSGCATDTTRTCVFTALDFPCTGQGGCYNSSNQQIGCSNILPGHDYHGQDGHYPGIERSYDDLGDGRVRDEVTGLVWTRSAEGPMGWTAAKNHCEDLTLASVNWRLPKRYELQSLVDYGSDATVGLDPVFDVPAGTAFLWTGTSLAGAETSTAWVVNVADGAVQREGKASTQPRVLCVAE